MIVRDVAFVARAPVRISFGGGGTDLAEYYERYRGLVVSSAITRYCYAVARQPKHRRITITSADYGLRQVFQPGRLPSVQEPLSLPKAAIELFAGSGLLDLGVDLYLASEVPPGSGLGSSSAMAVAVIRALAGYLDIELDASQVARICCDLEIERLGMPIGKQDQHASAFGGLNRFEFSTRAVKVQPLNLPENCAAALSRSLLLFCTGRTHNSGEILCEQRAASGREGPVLESLHRLKDLAREMIHVLESGELDGFGALLDEAWQFKKRLSGRISSGEIDLWYQSARHAGALGGKITGAGGGGFLLLYCPEENQSRVREAMVSHGLRELTFDLEPRPASLLQPDDDLDKVSAFFSGMGLPALGGRRLVRAVAETDRRYA